MAEFSIGTAYCYQKNNNAGRYSCKATYDSITRSGGTVTFNNFHIKMTRYSNAYTINRIACRVAIGTSDNYVVSNHQINKWNSNSASSYDIDLGNLSYNTNGTTIYLKAYVASTGSSTSWGNFQGNTPVSNSDTTFSCPGADKSVTLQINPQNADGSYAGWTTWKTITVSYGGSYSETWSSTGYNSVTFSGSNITSDTTNSQYATRMSYNITLNVNKQRADGSYEGASYWKTVSVLYGGSYSETWSSTGFNSVTFANWGITSSFTDTRNASRQVCAVTLNVQKEKVDGTFENAITWKTVNVLYGAGYSETWTGTEFNNVTFSSSSVTSSYTNTQNAYRKTYNLNLKGYLDGQDVNNITGYGTCSLSFNDGTSTQTGISTYSSAHRYGTTYTFYDIAPNAGYVYKGVWSGSLTGTLTAAATTKLRFNHDDYHPSDGGYYCEGDYYIHTENGWKKASKQ